MAAKRAAVRLQQPADAALDGISHTDTSEIHRAAVGTAGMWGHCVISILPASVAGRRGGVLRSDFLRSASARSAARWSA